MRTQYVSTVYIATISCEFHSIQLMVWPLVVAKPFSSVNENVNRFRLQARRRGPFLGINFGTLMPSRCDDAYLCD